MKLKLEIDLKDPNDCAGCDLFTWNEEHGDCRCSQRTYIYYDYKVGAYVNRDKCPLVPDNCCGGGCCKK